VADCRQSREQYGVAGNFAPRFRDVVPVEGLEQSVFDKVSAGKKKEKRTKIKQKRQPCRLSLQANGKLDSHLRSAVCASTEIRLYEKKGCEALRMPDHRCNEDRNTFEREYKRTWRASSLTADLQALILSRSKSTLDQALPR
jgi:hypothetical protein